MNDNMKTTDLKKIYSLIVSMREELQRLSLEIKALESLVNGVKANG